MKIFKILSKAVTDIGLVVLSALLAVAAIILIKDCILWFREGMYVHCLAIIFVPIILLLSFWFYQLNYELDDKDKKK